MEFGAILAWALAHEALLATVLLIISELLGAIPSFKSNGIVSFILVKLEEFAKTRGGVDPTPED